MLGFPRRRRARAALVMAALYGAATAWIPLVHAHAEVLEADVTIGAGQSDNGPRFHCDAVCGIGVHPELVQPAARDVAPPAAEATWLSPTAAVAPTHGPAHSASLPRAPPGM